MKRSRALPAITNLSGGVSGPDIGDRGAGHFDSPTAFSNTSILIDMKEITKEFKELTDIYVALFGYFGEEHFKAEVRQGNVSPALSDFVHRWGWDRALDRYDRYVRYDH